MEVLKNKKILGTAGIIICLLSVFLPYITVSILGFSESMTLMSVWEGKTILALVFIIALFIYRDFIQKWVPQIYNTSLGSKIANASSKLVIIPTLLMAGLAVLMILSVDVEDYYAHYSVGFYALWVGIACLLAHSFVYKGKIATVQDANNVAQQNTQMINNSQPMNNSFQQPVDQVNYGEPVQQVNAGVQPEVNPMMNQNIVQQPMNNTMQPIVNNQETTQVGQPMMEQQAVQNSQLQGNKFCPQCGTSVDASATFCSGCGYKF